jgi:hypothetical protein
VLTIEIVGFVVEEEPPMKVASAVQHAELYPDRHLNVFVPYGTHDLDYNVTRALIATLRWSRPQLTRDFLAEVVGVAVDGAAGFQFDLQASDFEDYDPSRAKRKIILGISTEGRVSQHLPPIGLVDRARLQQALAVPSPSARLGAVRAALQRPDLEWDDLLVLSHAFDELRSGSLPDGWIFTVDGSLCVLVEAKLLKLLHQEQLDRHAELWFGRKREGPDLVLTTWAKLAGFFDARRQDEDPRTRFLAGQLFDYLDLLGLAPFDGFRPYDFDGDALAELELPKFQRFVDEARKVALPSGALLGERAPTATGARIGFSNPSFFGEARLDLLDKGIRIAWSVGEALAGRFPSSLGVDTLLASYEATKKNPVAGLDLATRDFAIRVERLVPSPAGLVVDAETYRHAFEPDAFPGALEELRRQHPAGDPGRTPRRGALHVERTISREDALTGRDAVVAEAAKALVEVSRLAERVSAIA